MEKLIRVNDKTVAAVTYDFVPDRHDIEDLKTQIREIAQQVHKYAKVFPTAVNVDKLADALKENDEIREIYSRRMEYIARIERVEFLSHEPVIMDRDEHERYLSRILEIQSLRKDQKVAAGDLHDLEKLTEQILNNQK